MSVFDLKLVAIATMVVDHVGAFFFPGVGWLRVVGRLSFPLFAWLVANGARHTGDMWGYLRRLFVFAVVAQAPFVLTKRLVEVNFWELNVLFSLALGLMAVLVVLRNGGGGVRAAGVVSICAAAVILKVEYGAVGVLSVIASYVFFSRWVNLMCWQILIFVAPFFLAEMLAFFTKGIVELNVPGNIQMIAPLAFVLVYFYSGKQGPRGKYWFYAFYPAQFVVIYLLKRMGI